MSAHRCSLLACALHCHVCCRLIGSRGGACTAPAHGKLPGLPPPRFAVSLRLAGLWKSSEHTSCAGAAGNRCCYVSRRTPVGVAPPDAPACGTFLAGLGARCCLRSGCSAVLPALRLGASKSSVLGNRPRLWQPMSDIPCLAAELLRTPPRPTPFLPPCSGAGGPFHWAGQVAPGIPPHGLPGRQEELGPPHCSGYGLHPRAPGRPPGCTCTAFAPTPAWLHPDPAARLLAPGDGQPAGQAAFALFGKTGRSPRVYCCASREALLKAVQAGLCALRRAAV